VQFTVAAVLALTPLLILPGSFFYYDVTPKAERAPSFTTLLQLTNHSRCVFANNGNQLHSTSSCSPRPPACEIGRALQDGGSLIHPS
jgi:hypothetical protein